MMNRRTLLAIIVALLLLTGAQAQEKKDEKPKPEVKGLSALGVYRGKTTTVTVYGENLKPDSLTFEKGPLTAKAIGPVEATDGEEKKRGGQRLKVEVIAPADCPPDVYRMLLVHAGGEKPGVNFAVWEPASTELEVKRPCDTFANAMPLPGTFVGVTGAVAKGDNPDLFRFEAKAGEVWKVTLQAGRAGSSMDAVLRLRDARRTPLLLCAGNERADRELTFRPTRPGTYYLEVSDADSRDGPAFTYRLTLLQAADSTN